MLGWKLLLFQAHLVRHRAPALLMSGKPLSDRPGRVLNIAITTVLSFASQREGAEPGFHRRYKDKPCFQLSASFIGGVFIDGKLFGGLTNPKKSVPAIRQAGHRSGIRPVHRPGRIVRMALWRISLFSGRR